MYTLNKSIEGSPPNLAQYMPYDESNGYDPLNSEFRRRLPGLPVAGRLLVSSKYEYRLDLISYDLYGSTEYWWILLDYNYLDTPFQATIGREISYPSQSAIMDLFYSMNNLTSVLVEPDSSIIPEQTEATFTLTPNLIEFSWNDSTERLISITPEDIIQSVSFSVSSDDFRVKRVFRKTGGVFDYKDGYFTVIPTGINTSIDSDIEATIVFKYHKYGKVSEQTVRLVQKRPEQSITLYVSPTSLSFDAAGGTKKVTISPAGFEDSIDVSTNADWCSADSSGNVTVEPKT